MSISKAEVTALEVASGEALPTARGSIKISGETWIVGRQFSGVRAHLDHHDGPIRRRNVALADELLK